MHNDVQLMNMGLVWGGGGGESDHQGYATMRCARIVSLEPAETTGRVS